MYVTRCGKTIIGVVCTWQGEWVDSTGGGKEGQGGFMELGGFHEARRMSVLFCYVE